VSHSTARAHKDERPSGLIGSMAEMLKALSAVAAVVAMTGIFSPVNQQSVANAAGSAHELVQVSSLSVSRYSKFAQRMERLVDTLTRIRAEVRAEDGGEFYEALLPRIDFTIPFQSSDSEKERLRAIKQKAIDDMGERSLSFHKYDENDFFTKEPGTYIEIPLMCAARGERWCEPTVGLYVCIIDPSIQKKSTVYGVSVPKADENVGTIRIPAD
jgi:hypothetical protein